MDKKGIIEIDKQNTSEIPVWVRNINLSLKKEKH